MQPRGNYGLESKKKSPAPVYSTKTDLRSDELFRAIQESPKFLETNSQAWAIRKASTQYMQGSTGQMAQPQLTSPQKICHADLPGKSTIRPTYASHIVAQVALIFLHRRSYVTTDSRILQSSTVHRGFLVLSVDDHMDGVVCMVNLAFMTYPCM